jgi:hypothetical protein
MKRFVPHAVALLTLAALVQATSALAEDAYWVSGSGQTTAVSDEKPATPPPPAAVAKPAGSCCQQPGCCPECCESCCCEDPFYSLVGSFGLDAFKPNSFLGRFGAVFGLNSAVQLNDDGLGWQTGMSYGVYDFDGGATLFDPAQSETQVFLTMGFFRKAGEDRRLSFGIVYDWSFNENWSLAGNNPTLGQWRGQIEYALNECNGVGMWGCARDLGATHAVNATVGNTVINGTIQDRAITQANLFWHHKFEMGADSWLWVGVPDQGRFDHDGSLGNWIIGATLQAPLSERLALYANTSYMHPSASAGFGANQEAYWDVSMGVQWYFGGHAVSHNLHGKSFTPYMPVANNSTFLVEQNPGI